ncbi:hypothetical protein JCM19233_40 [Vibrio astriarenae]|nr:hypothetical protein JCM19233_40 [Vibrio sp. C7]
MFFLCEYVSGEPKENIEVSEIDFLQEIRFHHFQPVECCREILR